MGLVRKSVAGCADYAKRYRVLNGAPFGFSRHAWLEGIHDSDTPITVGQKAAQMGYTETALNITFYMIDMLKLSVLYVLPSSRPDAADFSSGRFDPALEESHHLRSLFSDTNNTGHKRAGHRSLYIRGSRARSHLKSLPVAGLLLDELDEMDQDNIAMTFERLSGQNEEDTRTFMLSTPTMDDFGINKWFKLTNQQHFYFRCPCCNRYITLGWDNIVMTSDDPSDMRIRDTYLVCHECKGKIPHEDKVSLLKDGVWQPDYEGRIYNGFHINQVSSPTVSPWKLAQMYLLGLSDPAIMTELHNSKLGQPFIAKGHAVTAENIRNCKGRYMMKPQEGLITMGVDVGTWLNVWIDKWDIDTSRGLDITNMAKPRCIFATKVKNFHELDQLMHNFQVNYAVIDADPERRLSYEFVERFYGRASSCLYRGTDSRIVDTGDYIRVHRTTWLDISLGRIIREEMELPADLPLEAATNLQAIAKTYVLDKDGNQVAKYINNKADHYAHARNYSEIALAMATSYNVVKHSDANVF